MKVALNGTSLLSPLTGIGQYTLHLALELQAMPDVTLEVFYGSGWSRGLATEPPRTARTLKSLARKLLPNPRVLARLFQQRRFDAVARRGGRIDLYHEPNYLAFRFAGPTVVTAHDLSWLHYPQAHPEERVAAMNRYFPEAVRQARVILTDSEFIREEMLAEYRLEPARVITVPLGVDSAFQPMNPEQTRPSLQAQQLTHGSYLLAVGTLEPRKNLEVALRAFLRLPETVRSGFPLVLVGMTGWKTDSLEREIAPLRASGQVRQLGYLSREDLIRVIAGARALVYPSIYEGFGLPPLEAMACGVPVVASNVSSIPEVVGNAGLLLSPKDVDGFADAMGRLIDDGDLHAELSRRSVARAAGFTWQACARQTRRAYEIALAAGH